MYKVEHAQPVASEPIRSGPIELRITQVFLEEHKTVLAVSHWTARLRVTIVSSERVPVESLSGTSR